jgi:Flp pilus assembly protein TadG
MGGDAEGAALVEGAILTPFLFVFIFGVLEFSFLFYEQHLMSTGVRDAARYLSRTNNPQSDSAIPANAQNLATTGSIAGGTYRRVTGWNPADVGVSFSSVANPLGEDGLRPYRGTATIQVVHVTGTFTYVPLGFFGFLGITSPVLSVTYSQRVIGPG